jgi:cellulose synthase (UDP-forming)
MRDPAPWLAVDMEGEVLDAGGHRHPCRIKAISETGAELHFRNHVPPLVSSSALRWSTAVPPLPIEISAERPLARAVAWGKTTARQQHALMQWLYGRSGCWRDRLAPQEWRALLALLKRVLFGTPAPAAFRRSLVPLAAQGSTSGQL